MSHHPNDDHHHNRRLYNPYQDLRTPAQTLYKLPTSPEFLFQEESIAQRRSWGDTAKTRVNRILNGSGGWGRKYGNRVGVIGLMYAGMESGMVAVRDTDDIVNSVVAGLGTGAVYRAAAVAGAVGGVAVGLGVKREAGFEEICSA